MKTSIILHGHFYQPPRELPDTGVIPYQPSAQPFKNWNERILSECYRANAFSRQLTYDGRIAKISNNYAYISFNFGPTLMKWLKTYSFETYSKLIEADRESALRLDGHGNAVAQAYNHTILPLDSLPSAELQVDWGIMDFQNHFNRYPEGFWLPEAAVNQDVIDILISRNITYVILSPWQASELVYDNGITVRLDQKPAPCNTSFRLEGKNGSITAFFYHPELASGISFGHFLQDADSLYQKLKDYTSHDNGMAFLHTATDGEIYGHHEPFGDMCLASLIEKIEVDNDIELTNYGAYLAKHPPVGSAILKNGEDKQGSSWSCVHGVSRWYKDCGCQTGGNPDWNQKWRTPLRNAFRNLRDRIDQLFIAELEKRGIRNHQELLRAYGAVVCGRETADTFIGKHFSGITGEKDRISLLKLFEGQKFAQFMFTSCGWFFSDISGIEPRQNIRYALQAADLYSDFLGDSTLYNILEKELVKAKSNKPDGRNGIDHLREIASEPHGVYSAIAYWVLQQEFATGDNMDESYGIYTLESLEKEGSGYIIQASHSALLQKYHCEAEIMITDKKIQLSCRIAGDHHGLSPDIILPFDSLPISLRWQVFSWIRGTLANRNCPPSVDHIKITRTLIRLCESTALLDSLIDSLIIGEVIAVLLNCLKSVTTNPVKSRGGTMSDVKSISSFIMKFGMGNDKDMLGRIFNMVLEDMLPVSIPDTGEGPENLPVINRLLEIAGRCQIPIRTTHFQEYVFSLIMDSETNGKSLPHEIQTLAERLQIML